MIAERQAITISPTAATKIRDLMPSPDAALRVGLKKGGCAGMEYTMEIIQGPGPHDLLVESQGARVAISGAAQMFLIGTEIDYASGLLESGFSFRNPNVSEACGCGESVSFKVER